MFTYTIMRQSKVLSDEGIEVELPTWEVWEVQASSAKEAVEDCADIPATYYCFECDPKLYEVDHFTRLKAVEVTDSDE